ncbi:carbohydrate ABC transporter permease [Diplocloster agilis]|uniref:carbohydrate ABC transporter permease n=1 Tax=Diplocloster agilis TaxID=2850323 RepID=UPI000821C35A|nr:MULTISPECIES: sugar ABC transporter permease [Lachnospiraceae]MBU9746418.1 sugar ABC transporter permease [Diplocloster agilis]MCU6732638.1 sugar ABC transporter permease [Suonthocola fibrivorans]SCI55561.1 sn-glycerol-3-phosphate transport system permease protein ugpA [uncultured Clostridium sp.]
MRKRKKRTRLLLAVGFMLPAYAFILFGFLIPGAWNIVLSFQEWDGFNEKKFVLFQNYVKAFHDSLFLRSISNSVIIAVVTMIGAVILGLLLAMMLYRLGKREGALYRLIIFMPAMIPVSIIGLLFTFIYNSDMGLLNQLLRLIGLTGLTNAWLENSATVLPCVIAVGIWRLLGMPMMLCFVSLQAVPPTLLEAGRIDGASYRQQMIHILLPLIRPTIALSMVFVLLNAFKTYDLVYVLTKGGPANASMTVPIYMQKTAFTYSKFSYSSTMGVLTAIIIIVIVLLTQRIMKGETYEF